MAITKRNIFDAADALDAVGQRPTLAALRKAVGGGSFTTISEAMKEWWAGRAARDVPAHEPAPPAVGERLGEVANEIWGLALQVANERLADEREAFDVARAQAEQEKLEAVELADAVSAELEVLQGKVSALEDAEHAALLDSATLRAQLAEGRERVARAEARAEEIEKRADDLNAELARVNGQNADLVSALAGAAKAKG
ncbi:MAG: DNA-binding protein [Azonexus sp.]|nr:DNA-binding protein [Azonexus sp.]